MFGPVGYVDGQRCVVVYMEQWHDGEFYHSKSRYNHDLYRYWYYFRLHVHTSFCTSNGQRRTECHG